MGTLLTKIPQTQMNTIDVYDIAHSKWYKQSTSGTTPKYRVNPCAVVASAAEYVCSLLVAVGLC